PQYAMKKNAKWRSRSPQPRGRRAPRARTSWAMGWTKRRTNVLRDCKWPHDRCQAHGLRHAPDHPCLCQGWAAMTWKPPEKRRVRAIRDRLRQMYGRPVNHPHGDPVHELVKTILSQNTSDTNRDTAYGRLRDRFETWEEVRDAPVNEVAEAIRPGGLSVTKAPRIQTALEGCGDPIDLSWLRDAPRDEAIDFLTSLPGVGRKTAACVLLFSFDRPEIPVDTHVHRVGGRLGL